jgi:AraC-like DNA-binding protein
VDVASASAAAIADRVGLSTRQLHRRSRVAFGYGVKTLQRILRLQLALELARDGARLADAAARAGYADQPHLAREMRDLAGVPATQLLR